jgi:hypothetical protein
MDGIARRSVSLARRCRSGAGFVASVAGLPQRPGSHREVGQGDGSDDCAEWVMADDMEYLADVPMRPPEDGRVIVHNRVEPLNFYPMWKPGRDGFRAWLSDRGWTSSEGRTLIQCDCGWAAQAGDHYRVRDVGQAGMDDGPP